MTGNRAIGPWVLVGLLALTSGTLSAQESTAEPQMGTIAGRVVDANGAGVAGAVVFVCDQATGMPVGANVRNVLTYQRLHGRDEKPLAVQTDSEGRFTALSVHAGTYRVFAQKWDHKVEDALEVNGITVDLLGSADNLQVPSDGAQAVELRPAGTGTIVFEGRTGNNESFVFLATEYPGDAVLGFFGWQAPFGNHVIGFNRMTKGQTTFRGVPDGKVGYTVFAADNSPGVNSGRGEITPERRLLIGKSAEEDMVAGWSNARYTPLPELQPVFKHVKSLVEKERSKEIWAAIAKGTEAEGKLQVESLYDAYRGANYELLMACGPLERTIELPGYGEATVNEVLASLGYLRLETVYADRIARRKQQQQQPTGTPPDETEKDRN